MSISRNPNSGRNPRTSLAERGTPTDNALVAARGSGQGKLLPFNRGEQRDHPCPKPEAAALLGLHHELVLELAKLEGCGIQVEDERAILGATEIGNFRSEILHHQENFAALVFVGFRL